MFCVFSRIFVLYSFYIVQKELRLRCDFYFQFAEESSTRVEFTSAGSIGPSFFASLHDILHRPLIAWPVQKERKYGSK